MIGICGLCKKTGELKNSHFIPSAIFKAVVQGYAPYANAPVILSVQNKTAVQHNFQPQKHFLCGDCEQRFCRGGEDYVTSVCHRKDGAFKLRDQLQKCTTKHLVEGKRVFLGSDIEGLVDVEACRYFALSIIWRNSVTQWPGIDLRHLHSLGSKYESAISEYLLGAAPAPTEALVGVQVDFDDKPFVALTFPSHEKVREEGYVAIRHVFMIPGVRFVVQVGRDAARLNARANPRGLPTFYEWAFRGSQIFDYAAQHSRSATPKGKLASNFP